MKHFFQISFVFFFWIIFSGQMCTKVMVYGKDYHTQPYTALFRSDRPTLMEDVKRALERFGYEIYNVDEGNGRIITGWRAVETDSHYFNMFGRKDYGATDGAYYQTIVDLVEQDTQTKVMVSTTVKSIAGKLESTGKIEKRILDQLKDYLRSPQIQMDNVGVTEK